MIYLFDKHKKLKGTVRARHTIALLYERERNGIYSVSAEIPVSLTDKRTVYNYHKKVKGSDFIGHYDREGRFQLHKIAAVDIENTSIFIKGIHLFFDEAKAGAIIRERRFRGGEITDGARVAFEPIGWTVEDFDLSDQKDYSFYNVSPLEARAILVETFGFEFDYWLDFDGKNLRNKQIAVKRRIGKETNKRYNYGHNVLSIKVEQDYSEIYTAVIGRGKGEDLDDSDGYGRRIEFTDVEWKKPSKPLDKAKGSRTLIDPTATQLFGYHDGTTVSPRTKVEIFSDIEDEAELLQASYEWLMDNNVPKAVFSLNVPDGDGLDLGDSVHVIYRDIDLIKSTRVTKVIDDLVSGNRSVEFGDSAYFETDRRISGLKADLKRVGGSTSSRITRLKAEFDKRFEDEIQQLNEDFEQALIDAGASVDAVRAEITDEFEAAQKEFEEEFNQSVADAKQHAEDAAEAKAAQVQANLDSFSDEHSKLISEVQSDVQGFSDTIEGISSSLSDVEGTLSNTRTALENRIDATENALDKVGEDLGIAKTDLQKQLDDARAELDGLEVGGRNLLPAFTSNKWTHENLTEIEDYSLYFPSGHVGNSIIFLDVEPNTNYTMTFNSDYARYYIYEVLEDDSLGAIVRTRTGTETYTFNTEDISRIRVSINTFSGNVQEEKNIWNLKLEKGTVATDWTPALEDTEQKITNINQTITNIEGELSTKVEQTEVDALKGTVTAQGTLLSQTAEELSSKAEMSVVDTLTGRVTNTESSVTQNAEEIAKRLTKSVYDEDKKDTDAKITQWSNTATETAEGLTRVIGRVSETEKGIDTAQTRIEAEAGRIDGLLSRTSNVEGKVQDAELAIKANADGLALRATKTEVENAIDGIEVGGRNLILNSAWNLTSSAYLMRTFNTSEELNIGEIYTLTIHGRLGEDRSFFRFYTDSGYSHFLKPDGTTGGGILEEVSEGVYRATLRYSNHGTTTHSHSSFRLYQATINDTSESYINTIQLEKGNKATDWSPAPEDFDASLTEVTDRVTTTEAELVVHAGEISQKASQSELDRVSGRVSTTEASIKTNADSIKLAATKTEVENAIDGIEVGGRNLILDSSNIQRRSVATGITSEKVTDMGYSNVLKINNPNLSSYFTINRDSYAEYPMANKDFTLSFLVRGKADGNSDKTLTTYYNGSTGYTPMKGDIKENEYSWVSVTFNTHDNVPNNHIGVSSFKELYFAKMKVEMGNKATDWSPAPEDLDASITGVSDRVTTAEAEIKVHAGEISQKASQSELDRVAGRVSTAETSIKQNSDSLKLTATKSEVENAIDGIEVGGRNLLLNSNVQYETSSYNIADYPLSEAIEEGTEVTISIKGQLNSNKTLFAAYNSGGSVQVVSLRPSTQNSNGVYVGTFNWRVGAASNTFLRVYHLPNTVTGVVSRIDWIKLEYGNKATDWTPAPEDTDAKINDISKDYVKQSSVKVTPDSVTIGSTVVNGSTIGSVLSVSPTGIAVVSDAMRLSGDLLVAGDVTALAVNAVEGNFSRLFTKSLTTNVIKSTHIQTDTALARKLFATNANIDELVTSTHFSNSIKTISIEAAKANFASATATWFGANVIESSWLNVDTALFNRFTSSTAFINSLTAKNAFISDIKAIDIDLNRATVTGGDGTNYIRMNNQNVMSYGTFTRSWGGETDSAKLELGIFDGQIRARNLDTGYRLYLTERGLSTSMAGAIDEFTSGTLEFHSQRFNKNSRGVTMHSSYGAVAMISDYSTAYIRSNLTANIESDSYSVYIRPTRLTRNGFNEFAFYVKANTSPQDTDGTLLFGDLTGDNSSGSGIRFSKRRNLNTVYITNIDGDIGTGDISVKDAEIRGAIRTIGGLDVRTWDGAGYNQITAGAYNAHNSMILSSHSGGNAYIGVGYNELRVTNNNGYNGGNTGYRPIRVHALHTTSSYAFENHSGGDTYFGVGGGRMMVTNNNHYNGGNIGWRDIEFRNWKANSHEKYKEDIKEWDINVLDIFKDELQLYQYKYRDNLENNMIHRGIVLREDSTHDKFPAEWRQDDGYNGNEVMWWNTKAIQELALENDSLKSEVAELRTQLNKIMEMIK